MPRSREESPGWGRVRIIQDAVAQHRALKLKAVIEFPPTAFRETEPYAWCWAAVTLLDRHPRYRDRFHQLIQFVREPDFNERFYRLFEPDWQELCEEWQLMVANMEYGYDVERSAVDFTPATASPLPLGEGPGVRAVTDCRRPRLAEHAACGSKPARTIASPPPAATKWPKAPLALWERGRG